jgi:hypothetical protein
MPASKIKFSDEDFTFIQQYKEAEGISIQRFVTVAVQEMIIKLKAEQALKDSPYTK